MVFDFVVEVLAVVAELVPVNSFKPACKQDSCSLNFEFSVALDFSEEAFFYEAVGLEAFALSFS